MEHKCSVPRLKGFASLGVAYLHLRRYCIGYRVTVKSTIPAYVYIRLIILLITDTSLIASSRRSYDNMIFARGASQSKIEHPFIYDQLKLQLLTGNDTFTVRTRTCNHSKL